jgi:uncharacterized membrane protein
MENELKKVLGSSKTGRSFSLFVLLVVLQAIMYVAVYVNIFVNLSIVRMVISFTYLLLVPGFVILELLDLKSLENSEKLLFSVGLSISFLMLIGLFINEIGKIFVDNPLSLNILLIGVNTAVLVAGFFTIKRNDRGLEVSQQNKWVSLLLLALLSVSLLLLGSYGIILVNLSGNSFFILILVAAISAIIFVMTISERITSPKYYPIVLLIIAICVLFFIGNNTSFLSRYLTGSGDQFVEYQAFQLTDSVHFWDFNVHPEEFKTSGGLYPTYSMLSVTILPTIFSVFTGMDGTLLYKLLYPLIVAFIAIGTYKLYRTQVGSKEALLSVFFLITISVGKGWGSAKQMVAGLFYVLLFLMLFRKDVTPAKKTALLVVFGASLVISHYALDYIFLLSIIFEFLVLTLLTYKNTGVFSLNQTRIPLIFVLIMSVLTFSWDTLANQGAAFSQLSQELSTATSNLGQFFDPASRGTALQGLGIIQTTSIYNQISAYFFLLTELLLVIGFLKLLISRKPVLGFTSEYKIIAFFNMGLIAINLLVPAIADTFLMQRFYQTTLIILAPLLVLGGKTILELVRLPAMHKVYSVILVGVVLVPLFLFQTGFVYEVTKSPSNSVVLSSYRWFVNDTYLQLLDDQIVAGAKWLPNNSNMSYSVANRSAITRVYSDVRSVLGVLTSYGMIAREKGWFLTHGNYTIVPDWDENNIFSFTYLSGINIMNSEESFNSSDISSWVEYQDKVYSNGQTSIYRGTPKYAYSG